jgi:Ca-activated chloride channel family protein
MKREQRAIKEENMAPKMALKSVAIKGGVIDKFADITVSQSYLNDISKNIEAVYTFPLPDNASVYRFTARTAGREIAGAVMVRQKAVKEYGKAILEGDSAALFESHRPDIFQVSLGQIGAGEQVDIQISYIAELKVSGGELRLLTPLVVAPRYIPAGGPVERTGTATAEPNDRVPDADKITPPSGDTSYRATAEITFDIGCGAESIHSPSHSITAVEDDFGWIKVTFADECVKMDRDFVLTAQFPKTRPERFLYGKAKTGECFSYISIKPELSAAEDETAREYNFLIDISGSMSGVKLDEAKTALKICLRNLSERDFFNIIAFESAMHPFMKTSAEYNQATLEAATRWVDALQSMGGTEIFKPVKHILADKSRGAEKIVILITDGEVGNEGEIISFVKKNGGNSRFFTVGVDTAVNSYFINGLAEASGGASEFVYPGEAVDEKILRHFTRIGCARLENISVSAGGAGGFEFAGELPKFMFSGDEFAILAKLASEPSGAAAVKGTINGAAQEYPTRKAEKADDADMLARLWAMKRIKQLEEYEPECNPARKPSVTANIIEISEKYSVLSKHTAFFARITRENKLSGTPETVVVPVEMPAKWKMDSAGASFGGSMANNVLNFMSPISVCGVKNLCVPDKMDVDYDEYKSSDSAADENIVRNEKSSPSRKIMSDICCSPLPKPKGSGRGPDDGNGGLKRLSMTQNADGSFGRPGSAMPELLKETAETIIKFTDSDDDLDLYRKILNKAVKFLLDNAGRLINLTPAHGGLILLAIENCMRSNILNQANKIAAEKFTSGK